MLYKENNSFYSINPFRQQRTMCPLLSEALLRWDFNDKSIAPNVSIPLAEKSVHIKEIGTRVLNRACVDEKHWQFEQQAAVSVDVSIIQLMDDGFIRLLVNCIRSSGPAPQRLHLEVTVSTFVENKEKFANN